MVKENQLEHDNDADDDVIVKSIKILQNRFGFMTDECKMLGTKKH